MRSLRFFSSVFSAGAVLGVALLAGTAAAQPQPAGSGALAYLQGKHSAVERVLRRPAKNADAVTRRNAEVQRAIGELLDFEEVSRQALGQHWTARSEAERTEFVSLLRQLVERNYRDNLTRTLEYVVRYESEAPGAGGTAVVRTTARSRTNRRAPAVEITYTMRRTGNAWKVIDVSTDGVSLVRNYRTQFGRIATRDGWPELIRRMRDRLAQGSAGL
jgi:phospholipid transport system substrate-binding protein